MQFARKLAMLACAFSAAFPLSAQATGKAGGTCAYAERKTYNAYPDLCEALRDNPHLQDYWSRAEAAGTSKAVIEVGLGGLSLLFSVIASSNFSDNISCISFFNSSEEDCHEKPVLPFMALGGATLAADLILLLTPNQKLAEARSVTRRYYREQYRNMTRKAPADSIPASDSIP